jgi:hypothetical protein
MQTGLRDAAPGGGGCCAVADVNAAASASIATARARRCVEVPRSGFKITVPIMKQSLNPDTPRCADQAM